MVHCLILLFPFFKNEEISLCHPVSSLASVKDKSINQEAVLNLDSHLPFYQLPSLEDGALIHGIFMDAMRWDTEVSKIAEASSGTLHFISSTLKT